MGKKRTSYDVCLFNDDYNTYEYIIYVLKTTLGWDDTQAMNCATIAGEVGQCVLKSTDYYEDAMYIAKVLESKNLTIDIIAND